MGHALDALVIGAEVPPSAAAAVDLVTVALPQGLTLLPLSADWLDRWAERLATSTVVSEWPSGNIEAVHRVAARLAPGRPFAVIGTDYTGGHGQQAAAAYRGDEVLCEPRQATLGPIDDALRALGVEADAGLDAFDTLGLGDLRTFDQAVAAASSGGRRDPVVRRPSSTQEVTGDGVFEQDGRLSLGWSVACAALGAVLLVLAVVGGGRADALAVAGPAMHLIGTWTAALAGLGHPDRRVAALGVGLVNVGLLIVHVGWWIR